MKQGWEIKKLGEVCESDLGKTLNQSKDTGELHPYLCAINILWDKIDFSTIKQTKFEESELERYSVRKGDLLICEGGDIGRAAIWNKDEAMLYQNALHRVRFDGSVVPRFCLLYLRFLKNIGVLDSQYGKGVTIKHLVKSSLLSIPIPVPPLPEQEKIVSELDCLSGIIEKKRQQLKELDALAQSIFYEMFGNPVDNERGWEVKSIKEIGKVITGNTPSRSVSEYYNSKDIEWIKTDNIESGKIHPTIAKEYLSKDGMMKGRVVECGAILVTCIAGSIASIGGCCIADRKVAFNQQINAVVPIGDINSLFLYYCLILSKRLIQDSASNGMKHLISKSNFEQIPLPLPPLPLQQSFAQKIEAIEQQKALIKQSIAEVETLFNARMQEYFE